MTQHFHNEVFNARRDDDPNDDEPIPKICPHCKGRGWIGILVRKPRRAFSARMLKCHCQLHDNKESHVQ